MGGTRTHGLLHLRGGVEEAVGRYSRVAVNQHNIVAHTNVAVCPGTAVFLKHLFEAGLVSESFVNLCPIWWCWVMIAMELLLNSTGEHQAKVHVRSLLEFALAGKAFGAVFWTSRPTDAVILVEVDARLSLFFGDDLQAVVVDEHICRAALKLIS